MKKEILVSIIVPVYNCEKYIDDCISSLINQTYKNIEIIIINDGSTDKSLEILKKYKDKRIKLYNQQNKGTNLARKKGITKSNGDYIMFVDSDDYISSFAVEKLVDLINKKSVKVIRFNGINEPSKLLKNPYNLKNKSLKIINKKEIYNLLLNTKILNNLCFTIYEKNLFDNISALNYDLSNCEDYLTNLDIYSKVDKLLIIGDVLYHYRENLSSTTKEIKEDKIIRNTKELLFVYNELFEYLKKWNLNTKENKKNVAFKIIESSKSCFFNILRVKNIKKKTIIDYSKEIFDSNIFENVREIISYNDIKKILKNSSFLYRIKHQNNIKNIYYKRYNRLYINKYLIKIKDFVRR